MKQAISLLGGILVLASLLGGCTESTAVRPNTPERARLTANAVVCAPGSFTGGNECIAVNVPECPSGTTSRDGQCQPDPPPTNDEPKPVGPVQAATLASEYDALLDPRRNHLQPRARQLLVTEIQGLEALFASMPKDAGDRPLLMRRLAEGYVELAAAAVRDHSQAKDAQTAIKTEKIEGAAHKSAVKYYQLHVDQYPSFCTTKSPAGNSGCADEPLYYLGLEYTRTNQGDNARKTLLKLIQAWPNSNKIGPAYFLFGEMFRAEAATDPSKWAFAEQSFAKAAQFTGSIQAPALLRLAEAYDKQGKTAEATAARNKVPAGQIPTPNNGAGP